MLENSFKRIVSYLITLTDKLLNFIFIHSCGIHFSKGKMVRVSKLSWVIITLVYSFLHVQANAETSKVLPAKVFNARLKPIFVTFKERWDEDGLRENIGHDFNNKNLNSEVFSDLSALERFYNLPDKSITAGTVQFDSYAQLSILGNALLYGVTDYLTIGAIVPMVHAKHHVKVGLKKIGNLAWNDGKDNLLNEDDLPIMPVDHDNNPDTEPLKPFDVESIQFLLTDGFGYQRTETWQGTGIGDIELLTKLNIFPSFLKLSTWESSMSVTLRLPTGQTDNPDSLVDFGLGDGQTDLIFGWQNDFLFFSPFIFNVSVSYNWQLPDRQVLRVYDDPNIPITDTNAKENVYRDLGDSFSYDISANYPFNDMFSYTVGYAGFSKQRDWIGGYKQLAYEKYTKETAQMGQKVYMGFTYSTVSAYMKKESFAPYQVTLGLDKAIIGKNNYPNLMQTSLEMGLFF